MIGDPVKPAGHARGIYTIFPTRAPEKEWMSRIGTSVLHRDSQPFQLGIVVYLSDVEENDMGAYTVLPGSHVRVYHEAMASEYHSEPSAEHNRVCKELRDEIKYTRPRALSVQAVVVRSSCGKAGAGCLIGVPN